MHKEGKGKVTAHVGHVPIPLIDISSALALNQKLFWFDLSPHSEPNRWRAKSKILKGKFQH